MLCRKSKTADAKHRITAFGQTDRLLDVVAVAFIHIPAFVNISAVNRKTGDGLANRLSQYASR